MPKAKRKGRSEAKYESYCVRVEDCRPTYSFHLNDSKHFEGPYWEHLAVTFVGHLISPQRLKWHRLPLMFLGRRDEERILEQPNTSDWKPLNIGVLTLRRERTEFLGSLPNDALWALLNAHLSGAFQIIHLHGRRERGRTEIRSVHFECEVDPEDLEL